MKIYGWSAKNLSVVERGECDLDLALETLRGCYQRGFLRYETGEQAMSETSFGLSRTKLDYIDVSCSGPNFVLIHFDRLFYPSSWSRWWIAKRRFEIKGDRELAERIVSDYFELERSAFEDAYSSFRCR